MAADVVVGAPAARSEVRDGMRVDWNVEIPVSDGVDLRCDVFRPVTEGRYPAVLTYGPYAKGLAFQDAYRVQWEKLVRDHPEVVHGSSNLYQNWEVVDPERWVPDGYACVRVDSRGAGWSPGVLDVWSPRETRDFYECIEWAAAQPWCSGRVGLLGISYYAMNQWQVAALRPPHLAAMIPWEGAADFYRDAFYHGGMLSNFPGWWFPRQVASVQHGLGGSAPCSRVTGEPVAGPAFGEGEREANRVDLGAEVKKHPLDERWHHERSADLEQIEVPFLSAANWAGHGLHTRGNFDGFLRAGSAEKWLEVHSGDHWGHFYSAEGLALQKRFFARFLKGDNSAWRGQPSVYLNIRRVDGTTFGRGESEWPMARTEWMRLHLHARERALHAQAPGTRESIEYDAPGNGITFNTEAFLEETEITGPLAARLWISSTTTDADLFLAVRVFDPEGTEICFQGSQDPLSPLALGWLRASHRKLDESRSRPYQPFHTHDEVQPLVPGEVYGVDVEIWPTCVVVPAGYRLALTVRGRDYESDLPVPEWAKDWAYAAKGVPPNFMHTDPDDRPADVINGRITLHTGGEHQSYLIVPVVPPA